MEPVKITKVKYVDFHFDEFANKNKDQQDSVGIKKQFKNRHVRFEQICDAVKQAFIQEWDKGHTPDNSESSDKLLERQKRAIIGYPGEVNYFKEKILEYLKKYRLLEEWYPDCYKDLVEAIFHENWGLAGIAAWMDMKESSSAKIIGDRIYFLINGKAVLQEQRIKKERFEQLLKALLIKTPEKRQNEPYYEIYMLSGERIAVYAGDITKEGQQAMVFRKYIVNRFTFEEQAARNTIPPEAVEMFKAMVAVGYNVIFTGAVRTSKTTFLTTWQSYENPALEGVSIETDPEIPFHLLQPNAPIIQLVADGERLLTISKSVLRSDADYIILGEARDGYAFYLGVEMANKGTLRCKTTAHLTFVEDICYDIASKIRNVFGGSLTYHIAKVARSYHYIFHFVQLKDKSRKRLDGIYEMRFNAREQTISIHRICKYDYRSDRWEFRYDIGDDKRSIGMREDAGAMQKFEENLIMLENKFPMKEIEVIQPLYNRIGE